MKAVLALLCCAAAVFLYRGVRERKRLSAELEETGKTAQRLEA